MPEKAQTPMHKRAKTPNNIMTETLSPITLYKKRLSAGDLTQDADQKAAIVALNHIHEQITALDQAAPKGWSLFKKAAPKTALRGLYMHGGVGRGKSMLMDLFFDCLPPHIKKKRVHFHEFMISLHDFMHDRRQSGEARTGSTDAALLQFAQKTSSEVSILCFDEFHITDVADAMLLGRLFTALFDDGVTVIATSNWPPDRLYEGGLQRELFLPFIALLQERMDVIALDGEIDYRLQYITNSGVYFSPLGAAAQNKLDTLYNKLTQGIKPQPDKISVKGRTIEIKEVASGIARTDFSTLCERPLGAEDYLSIAKAYHTLFLEKIPKLNYDRRNEAKRLMTLIDALYENNVKLVVSADADPGKLYLGHDHSFEFERTISRLMEMQSTEYIQKPHTGCGKNE